MQNSDTTKYVIYADIHTDGVVEKPDVVGAIFGQTEGLLGDDLDLRELQKTGRIGRIEVNISSKSGKSDGTVLISSSLDKIETSILAASLETIDRVGPCIASIAVTKIEDVRASKRRQIVDQAKHILLNKFDESLPESQELTESVKQAVRVDELVFYGKEKLPAGPNVQDSDAILIVEGRADVLNLLRHGIKNAIAVEGTNVPKPVIELSKKKTVTTFLDGDRGGELILKELLQIADVDYVAYAPEGKSVEDLSQKEIVKALRNKLPIEQVLEQKAKRKPVLNVRKEPEPAPQVAPVVTKELPPVDNSIRNYAEALNGTLNAVLLDAEGKVLKEVEVRNLVNALKESNGLVKSVVFDGVITQRILDIAAEKELDYLIGVKIGNVVKRPLSVKVLTIEDIM
ncbi:MAG TPA: DNA primase DnaG [Candidatus Acidoferrales bacterium]|nr:DNA primase DnaG [Candidatus Acidoferrales bacterium]